MSLTFTQICNKIDKNCHTEGNAEAYPVADKTVDINLALDKAFSIIFKAAGTWQFDDSNHEDYPMITTSLVSGQRDYSFVDDENGNLVLDIYKVMIKDKTGEYIEIFPVDAQSDELGLVGGLNNGKNEQGTPNKYDKTGNGIFLDLIPDYNSDAGLQIWINREGSYFISTDSTKKPGFNGLYHEYLALRPSYYYAFNNGLANANNLKAEMVEMEKDLKGAYAGREKDVQNIIEGEYINSI